MIIKGISIGALFIILLSDAFPNTFKNKFFNKNINNNDNNNDSQKISDLSITQSHYNKLIEQIVDLVSVVNPEYMTAIYMTDSENNGYKKQNNSNVGFEDFVDLNNEVLSKIINNSKPIVINKDNKDESWEEIVGKKTERE